MKCNFHLLRLLLPVLLLIQTSCGLNQKPRRLPTLADTCAGILTVKRGLDPDGAYAGGVASGQEAGRPR